MVRPDNFMGVVIWSPNLKKWKKIEETMDIEVSDASQEVR